MGSLARQIIVVILSVSILNSQVTYTVQKIPFFGKSSISNKFNSSSSMGIQALVSFGTGAITNIVHNFFSKSPTAEYNHEELLNTLETRINQQFDKIKILIDGETDRVIASLKSQFDDQIIFNEGLLKLSELNEEYKTKFLMCVRQKKCSERTRKEYIKDFVTNGHERVTKILGKFIYRDGLDDGAKRLFDVIIQSFEHADQYGNKNRCADGIQERQKFIYNIYSYIFGIICQHYEKIVYSLLVQRKEYKSVNSTDAEGTSKHMKNIVNDMIKDFKLTTEAAHTASIKIPRDFTRLCDPKEHKRGETYEKLTYFIQPYVVPVDHLTPGPIIGDAKTYFDKTCDAQSLPPFYVWPESRYECHTYRQLVNCKYLAYTVSEISWEEKGYGLKFFKTQQRVFVNKPGNALGSLKSPRPRTKGEEYGKWSKDLVNDKLAEYVNRYVYHQKEPVFFGLISRESDENKKYEEMEPFYICDLDSLNPNYSGIENVHPTIKGPVENFLREKSPDFGEFYDNTVRKFSELPVQVSSGKILTGVRFRVINRIIYMQIQQGNYISGIIDSASLEWKKIDENQEKVQELNIHRRSFNLDDVEVPLGSFVTGVQFVFNRDTISLGVYGTEVDKDEEILYDETEYEIQTTFYTPPLNLNHRQEIKLEKPGPSDWAPNDTQHEIKSKPGISFVKFQLTDPKKDLHTIVPYLDIRMVNETVPKPLGGIGIEYRGKEGYGGFIGFKLISTDVISKLDVNGLMIFFQKTAKNMMNEPEETEPEES